MMESSESPPQEKWHNLTAKKCAAAYDVLARLEKIRTLPEGKTPGDASLSKGGDMMDYAERILTNDQFWATLPEEIPTGIPNQTISKMDQKAALSRLIRSSR